MRLYELEEPPVLKVVRRNPKLKQISALSSYRSFGVKQRLQLQARIAAKNGRLNYLQSRQGRFESQKMVKSVQEFKSCVSALRGDSVLREISPKRELRLDDLYKSSF